MELIIDILLKLVSYLPRIFSFWLYAPTRTKKLVEVSISANDGSIEIWCDKHQAKFNVTLEFRNDNPFAVEIDRIAASGNFYTASVNATDLLGASIAANKKARFYLSGKIDPQDLEQIIRAPDDETLRLYVRAIVINKYHHIRDFTHQFDRLMCRCVNKKQALAISASVS